MNYLYYAILVRRFPVIFMEIRKKKLLQACNKFTSLRGILMKWEWETTYGRGFIVFKEF